MFKKLYEIIIIITKYSNLFIVYRGAVSLGPPPGPSQQRGIQSRGRSPPVDPPAVVQLRK